MSQLIDANQAKEILGCDDATLQGHINAQELQVQKVGGKLMFRKEEVEKLHQEGDATIVLTGDSDNFSIDLGKVVDETSATIVQPKGPIRTPAPKAIESASITFGDELEVVSFDETATRNVAEDATIATKKPSSQLSFTDSNTAVAATAVEETQVGGTTAPIDFTTSQMDQVGGDAPLGTDAGRRSVRSSRVKSEVVVVWWLWPALMGLTLVIGLTLIAPYYVLTAWPHGTDELDAKGGTLRGVEDNGWTGLAGSWAGFSVEPNKKKFQRMHGDAEFRDIKTEGDPQAEWRFEKYLGTMTEPGERASTFVIEKVSDDGTKATSKGGKKEYPMAEQETSLGNGGSVKELKVTVWTAP